MFRRAHVRVAGVIENMTAFECEHGTSYSLFGDGGGDRLAAEIGVPVIGRIPLHPDMVASADRGEPVAHGDEGPLAEAFGQLALRVSRDISPVVDTASCTARLLDDIERRLGNGDLGNGDLGNGDLGNGDLGEGELGEGELGESGVG
jgi:ATP-binding protein involved in chromosome partitioning